MVVAVSTPSDDQLVKDCEKALDREQPTVEALVKAYGSKVGALIYPIPHAHLPSIATQSHIYHLHCTLTARGEELVPEFPAPLPLIQTDRNTAWGGSWMTWMR